MGGVEHFFNSRVVDAVHAINVWVDFVELLFLRFEPVFGLFSAGELFDLGPVVLLKLLGEFRTPDLHLVFEHVEHGLVPLF